MIHFRICRKPRVGSALLLGKAWPFFFIFELVKLPIQFNSNALRFMKKYCNNQIARTEQARFPKTTRHTEQRDDARYSNTSSNQALPHARMLKETAKSRDRFHDLFHPQL
jgi:hypothetical protein